MTKNDKWLKKIVTSFGFLFSVQPFCISGFRDIVYLMILYCNIQSFWKIHKGVILKSCSIILFSIPPTPHPLHCMSFWSIQMLPPAALFAQQIFPLPVLCFCVAFYVADTLHIKFWKPFVCLQVTMHLSGSPNSVAFSCADIDCIHSLLILFWKRFSFILFIIFCMIWVNTWRHENHNVIPIKLVLIIMGQWWHFHSPSAVNLYKQNSYSCPYSVYLNFSDVLQQYSHDCTIRT